MINTQAEQTLLEVKGNDNPQKDESKLAKVKESQVQQMQKESSLANHLNHLPGIKPRGKIYNQQQMAASYHLLDETVQQYKVGQHLIHINRKTEASGLNEKAKVGMDKELLNNKFLKMVFQKFCSHSYNYKGFFGQIVKECMNLNKWMVFCKEFDFNQKFHKKHLIQIYQQATHFSSTMSLSQFLTAVALLKQKYIDKYHKGQDFMEEVLHINSKASFKVKMNNLKVRYGGPARNSFQLATYQEHVRMEEVHREKQFLAKKKEREMVLIKGMHEEHMREQLQRLKKERQQRKLYPSKIGNNWSMIEEKSARGDEIDRYNHRSSRPESLNYSTKFHIKHQTPQKTTEYSLVHSTGTTPMYKTEQEPKIDQKDKGKSKLGEPFQMIEEVSIVKNDPPQRQWLIEKERAASWLTHIRSDSQESDEILKEHMQIEKKMDQSRSRRVQNLMKEREKRSTRVQQIRTAIQDQMVETRADFRA